MPPNPFIVIYTINPPQQTWVQHSHTEVVEVSIIKIKFKNTAKKRMCNQYLAEVEKQSM
jgi:hypothetical protein